MALLDALASLAPAGGIGVGTWCIIGLPPACTAMSDTFDPPALFEVLLPAILADLGARARDVDGVVQFDLAAAEEARSWFLDLSEGRAEVVEGEHEAPDVSVFLEAALVLPMLTGALDVEAAIERGEIDVAGDPAVLGRLARAMTGGMSALSVRLGDAR